jgi:ParB-like chromosome segregation protein Spo0J
MTKNKNHEATETAAVLQPASKNAHAGDDGMKTDSSAVVNPLNNPATALPPAPAENGVKETEPKEAVTKSVIDGPVVKVLLANLKPHPLSVATYGTGFSENLTESVRTIGIMQPLVVAKATDEIIAGNSRAGAAREVGIVEVPVIYYHGTDPLEIEAMVLDTNKMRVKTAEQLGREVTAWRRIESERAKLRMATNAGGQGMKTFSEAEKGAARDKAAEKVGVSGVTADKVAAVVAVIDNLERDGKKEEAAQLRTLLNEKSIDAAHKEVKAQGLIPPKKATAAGSGQSSKKTAKGVSKQNAGDTKEPKAAAEPQPELDAAHEKATAHADEILTFLKSKAVAGLSKAQKHEWQTLGTQIAKHTKALLDNSRTLK